MKKVRIDFPTAFEHDAALPIPLARFYVGHGHILRYVFTPNGKTKLVIPQSAIDDGSVVISKTPSEDLVYG